MTPALSPPGTSSLDRDMFALIWGPTIAAVSVVLDHAEDQGIIQQCLEGLKLAAKMAAYHHVDEVSTPSTSDCMGQNLYATLVGRVAYPAQMGQLRVKSLTLSGQVLYPRHHSTLSDHCLLPGCSASPVCCRLALPASVITKAH